MKRETRAPTVVAIVLLLLPLLYAASYLALVVPEGRLVMLGTPSQAGLPLLGYRTNYRIDGYWPGTIFWPMEQIDRKVRPGEWQSRAREQVKQLESQIKFN